MSDEPGRRTSGPDIAAVRLDVDHTVDERVCSRRGGSGDGAICIFICCTSSATLWGWEGVMGGGEDVPEGEEAETTDGTRESTRRSPRSSLSLSECGDGFDTTSSVRCPPR